MTATAPILSAPRTEARKPRLGFLGVGWIGRNRLEAIARSGLAEIAAIADSVDTNSAEAGKTAPKAVVTSDLPDLLSLDLDGVVIATPSALHAQQSIVALEAGLAVFCQKPLARTRAETRSVVEAAKRTNRLLGVDLSYRFTSGIREIRRVIQSGELGQIYTAELVFHNAYGPDKPWFYDYRKSGGGCVIDLGIHLVDLALHLLEGARVEEVSSRLYAGGRLLQPGEEAVEDYAIARLDLDQGRTAQVACSWKLPAGQDAIISVTLYGTNGGLQFRNVNGSFYEFEAERFYGTRREKLWSGQEDWGGRAAVDWVKKLCEGEQFDSEVERLIDVAGALDAIYGRE